MINRTVIQQRFVVSVCVLGVALAAVIGLTVACNLTSPGSGTPDGTDPPPGQISCAITNLPWNFQIELGTDIQLMVKYSISANATNVRGFYVQVASADENAPEIGEDVIVAEGLSPGSDQSFALYVADIPAGYFRVGIRETVGDQEYRCLSPGALEVTGTEVPEFTQPTADITAEAGVDVMIGFDLHDSEGAVHWRLFHINTNALLDAPPNEIGTQIRVGQGESAPVAWNTSAVPQGTYYVGLSTTRSGLSVEQTVVGGDEDQVWTLLSYFTITIVEAQPPASESAPTIEVTQPKKKVMVTLGDDSPVNIEFVGTIREADPISPSITLFLDLDLQHDSGNEIAIDVLDAGETSYALNPETLEADTYYVGATLDDGVNAAVTDYATGTILVDPFAPNLEVSSPDLTDTVPPGTEVDVRWTTTNVGADDATVDVFRLMMDADGTPTTGTEISILDPTDADVKSATFITAESGLFQISVRLVFKDTSLQDMIVTAPSLVRVTSSPRIVWVGDLANAFKETSEGAIFEGVQFEDNAGSVTGGGEDFNQDSIDDFFIVAQYGKPGFFNPSGIGDGEIYIIRGNQQRYAGSYNLNRVSSPEVPGTVLTGIPPNLEVGDTWGPTSVLIGADMDGDNIGELLVGFPFVAVNRETQGPLLQPTMFENGGVVVLSSKNSVMRGDGSLDEAGSRIELERVGMKFDDRMGNREVVGPEPGDDDGSPGTCTLGWAWMADIFSLYTDSECPDPEEDSECVEGEDGSWNAYDHVHGCLHNNDPRVTPDGEADTLIEPKHGFARHMARDFINYKFSCT